MLVGSCISGTFANMKIERQGWSEMPLILGRPGTQYVAMRIKLLSFNCGAHLVESYCKASNISDTNWPRYPFSSYLIKTWLSIQSSHGSPAYFKNLNISGTIYNHPPKGRRTAVDIHRDTKRRGTHPPLPADPEGDSCFSIYHIRWIKKCCFN